MLKVKPGALKFVWAFFAVWTLMFLSMIVYLTVVYISSPYAAKFIECYVIFVLFALLLYGLVAKYILMRVAKSIEKIGDDLYRVQTLTCHYDVQRKDVTVDKFGRIKIDVYSGIIRPQCSNYIDTTPKQNFWEDFLGNSYISFILAQHNKFPSAS